MESIGEKFRLLREERGLTIKEVVDETNISPTYLQALENEDFDKFPGETYITGFIRSYAEYLKIDSEDLIKAYKGYKIGESVTPLEELTKPTSPRIEVNLQGFKKNLRYVLFLVVLICLGIGGFFAVKTITSNNLNVTRDDSIDKIKTDHEKNKKKPEFEQVRNLKLTNNKGFALAYRNEAVQFLVDSKECMFILNEVKQGEVIISRMPDKEQFTLKIDHAELIPFKETSREVYVTLRGNTENRAKIMVTIAGTASPDSETIVIKEENDEAVPAVSTQVRATDRSNLKIVFEALFLSKTYLEVYLDGQQKARGIIQAGTREVWEANEFVQIKVGNAGGLKAIINGQEFSFGLPGQVANKVITWKKDPADPNLYNIVVKDW